MTQESLKKHTSATEDSCRMNVEPEYRSLSWTPQGIVEVKDGYAAERNASLGHKNTSLPRLPEDEFFRLLASPNHLTLLVYGTLKSGYWNHDRFCCNAIDIRPATVWGHLRHLTVGYPALEVPEFAILAHGTADPLTDAATQARLAAHEPQHASDQSLPGGPPSPRHFGGAGWDLIHGELITFPDPACDLPPIDRLEGFLPNRCCMYRRILVFACSGELFLPAWLYCWNR